MHILMHCLLLLPWVYSHTNYLFLGQIAGTVTILRIIKSVAEGTDFGDGAVGSPQIEAARHIVLELKNNVEHTALQSTAPSKNAKQTLENIEELIKLINI